jgi:chromosome segregation ATPase
MTPEERFERIEQKMEFFADQFVRIERKIEFIVDQQAQFTTDLQALRETQAVMQRQIDQNYTQTQQQIAALNEAVVAVVGMVGNLAEWKTEMGAKMKEVAEGMRKLEEKGAETEQRLNILIGVVERHLSGPDHGPSRARKPNVKSKRQKAKGRRQK